MQSARDRRRDYAARPPASLPIAVRDSSRSSILIRIVDRILRIAPVDLCSIYPLILNGELSLRLVVGAEESEAREGERNLAAEGPRCILERRASLYWGFFFSRIYTRLDRKKRPACRSDSDSSLFFLSFENGRPSLMQRTPIGNECRKRIKKRGRDKREREGKLSKSESVYIIH